MSVRVLCEAWCIYISWGHTGQTLSSKFLNLTQTWEKFSTTVIPVHCVTSTAGCPVCVLFRGVILWRLFCVSVLTSHCCDNYGGPGVSDVQWTL